MTFTSTTVPVQRNDAWTIVRVASIARSSGAYKLATYSNESRIVSVKRVSDNYMQDSKNWPDPTEPRASKPPAPEGCTCPSGHKLDCPVHGMDAQGQSLDMDNQWANVQQANPIGYPQDAPRSWQQAYSSLAAVKREHQASDAGPRGGNVQDQREHKVTKLAVWKASGPAVKVLKAAVKRVASRVETLEDFGPLFVSHSLQSLSRVALHGWDDSTRSELRQTSRLKSALDRINGR